MITTGRYVSDQHLQELRWCEGDMIRPRGILLQELDRLCCRRRQRKSMASNEEYKAGGLFPPSCS